MFRFWEKFIDISQRQDTFILFVSANQRRKGVLLWYFLGLRSTEDRLFPLDKMFLKSLYFLRNLFYVQETLFGSD